MTTVKKRDEEIGPLRIRRRFRVHSSVEEVLRRTLRGYFRNRFDPMGDTGRQEGSGGPQLGVRPEDC